MRILYLTASLSLNGRGYLRGRAFASQLQADGHEILLRHQWEPEATAVVQSAAENGSDVSRDITDDREMRDFAPDVIFLESGVNAGPGRWRIPPERLEEYVTDGGVVIAEGLGLNGVQNLNSEDAERIWRWFGARPEHEAQVPSWSAHIVDHQSNTGQASSVICRPEVMVLSEWLRPCFKGIDTVVASLAIPLTAGHSVGLLASSGPTSLVSEMDRFIEDPRPYVWATVKNTGFGYRVLLAATVTHDVTVESNPDNARWMEAVMAHLVDESSRDRELYEPTAAATEELEPTSLRLPASVLVTMNESSTLEFKSTAFTDLEHASVPEKLTFQRSVGKTVAAFLNASGGTLVIGCRDNGEVVGWEPDQTGSRRDVDRYLLALTDRIAAVFGQALAASITVEIDDVDEHQVAVVSVSPGHEPVYIEGETKGTKEFYVRVNNSTRKLDIQETVEYTLRRWPRG